MTAPTPGPWKAHRNSFDEVLSQPFDNDDWFVDAGNATIARIGIESNNMGPKHPHAAVQKKATKNAPANARLIAAAPDLLAALEWMLRPTVANYNPGGMTEMTIHHSYVEKARAAIARAKMEE